jgi:tRNA-(ms[2]io[6]A)-hydroxylase
MRIALPRVPPSRYDFTMLNLQVPTPPRWLAQVSAHLDELLIDHAHCEKKAAGVAMNLLFAYVDEVELVRAMSAIVQEELSHFHLVLDLLERRGIRFRKIPPSRYGAKLHALADKQEPMRAVDRLLIAALIEARSCERFGLLRDHLEDRELADFFGNLFESEARHHSTYVRLARLFATEERVTARLEALAAAEARIIDEGEDLPRVHS